MANLEAGARLFLRIEGSISYGVAGSILACRYRRSIGLPTMKACFADKAYTIDCSGLALEKTSRLEWLETNGLGGFASGTVSGINTRRYHGLLVAALRPPVERVLLVNSLEESLLFGCESFALSAHRYHGAVHPTGFDHLAAFRYSPCPSFEYSIHGCRIVKSVLMPAGLNAAVIRYSIRCGSVKRKPVTLNVKPLVSGRDFHSLVRENYEVNPEYLASDGILRYQPYPFSPAIYFSHNSGSVCPEGYWYREFLYEIERERGLDDTEDLYCPFSLEFNLALEDVMIVISTEPIRIEDAPKLEKEEIERRGRLTAEAHSGLLTALYRAADQFIVRRNGHRSIIAGYPWFSDWGRDTMIALPGLTIFTGRHEDARDVLAEFARHASMGMLPNRFPDEGEDPEYNTVDAALWFFEAVRAYLSETDDIGFVRDVLFASMVDILRWHADGTRYGIGLDEDGLLKAGDGNTQLTWMDARIDGYAVTPRHGKPVEIQALWYNALQFMERLGSEFGHGWTADFCCRTASEAKASFNAQFWNSCDGCLYDVIAPDGPDPSIRPNQLIALSLEHCMLTKYKAGRALEVVRSKLLTPYGLRTLPPSDERYRGRYSGGVWERDTAYHQGTVWPWLLGPYAAAALRVKGESSSTRRHLAELLEPFQKHLREAGLGQVSEVFDGDPPHSPGGCFAQAWSVAALIEIARRL